MFFFLVRHDIRHFPLRHPLYFYGGFFTFRHEPPSAINNIDALETGLNDRPLSQVEVNLTKSLQVQLWEAAYAYESMLRQEARVKWLKEGDSNSTYFHRLINHRRRKNAIQGIFMDGVWVHEPCSVKNAAVLYFKDRFSEECSNRPTLDGVHFSSLDLKR